MFTNAQNFHVSRLVLKIWIAVNINVNKRAMKESANPAQYLSKSSVFVETWQLNLCVEPSSNHVKRFAEKYKTVKTISAKEFVT